MLLTCKLNVKRGRELKEYLLCFAKIFFGCFGSEQIITDLAKLIYKCSNIYIVMFYDMLACDSLSLDEINTNVANI